MKEGVHFEIGDIPYLIIPKFWIAIAERNWLSGGPLDAPPVKYASFFKEDKKE